MYVRRFVASVGVGLDMSEMHSSLGPSFCRPFSVQSTGCSMNSHTRVRTYNKDDDNQKFKLVKMGDKFLIKSKACDG